MKLTRELLREFIHYDPETGVVTWNRRDQKWFKNENSFARWNAQHENMAIRCERPDGYVVIGILGKIYRLHRIIWLYMTGKVPYMIDHINGIRNDNRWVNLREVDDNENSKNLSKPDTNTSGFVGVCFHVKRNQWRARIYNLNKEIHLGWFKLKEDAIQARKQAEIKYGYHPNHGR